MPLRLCASEKGIPAGYWIPDISAAHKAVEQGGKVGTVIVEPQL